MLTKIKYPLILDGGLSNVLEAFGCDLNHTLWSAKLLIDQPEIILRAHLAYLEAGANCISTAGYQASIEGFMKTGSSVMEAENLILRSVELAEKAREVFLRNKNSKKKIYVAASMGPYGAILADGSEYHGDYSITEKALSDFHAKRIKLLASTKADFFAFETIPSMMEVKILSDLLNFSTKPSWVSFSC